MTDFLQLHLLTSYPPANLNRDDLGRPKTAVFGNAQRLRVSSQSLKRAWRTSAVFADRLAGSLGVRTKAIGERVQADLVAAGMKDTKAEKATRKIIGAFGKVKKDSLGMDQLVHFSPAEQEAISKLCEKLVGEDREPTDAEVEGLLGSGHRAADIALFGRMLADTPRNNVEAACQVAHALGVHASVVEDDYFSAVDDLNRRDEDMGAGHIGELGFGAALLYSYVCVNFDQLLDNLDEDAALANATTAALIEAATTVSPTGKQNSFGSRAYASFVLAERGSAQPRSLSVAFLKPISGHDVLDTAVSRLLETRAAFAHTYGERTRHCVLDVARGEGSLDALIDFASAPAEPA